MWSPPDCTTQTPAAAQLASSNRTSRAAGPARAGAAAAQAMRGHHGGSMANPIRYRLPQSSRGPKGTPSLAKKVLGSHAP